MNLVNFQGVVEVCVGINQVLLKVLCMYSPLFWQNNLIFFVKLVRECLFPQPGIKVAENLYT